MRIFSLLTIAFLAGVVSGDWTLSDLDLRGEHAWHLEEPTLGARFEAWRTQFGKTYAEHEREYRKAIWKTTMLLVNAHNKRSDVSYKLHVNHYADITAEEFEHRHLMIAPQAGCSATSGLRGGDVEYLDSNGKVDTYVENVGWTASPQLMSSLPKSFDWREHGILSLVKNQGHCGSCWTFSSTGALEAHYKLYHNMSYLFSEQELVDCAGNFDTHGCQGGLPSHAFEFLKSIGGIETEDEYPYKAQNQACQFNPKSPTLIPVRGSMNITKGDEDSLTAAIATKGPVSIAFKVQGDFRLYHSGVYSGKECANGPQDVNHAVLAVGFGEEAGVPYYVVKNSWGPEWGDQGFFKIVRGQNMCGVAVCNSFPLV